MTGPLAGGLGRLAAATGVLLAACLVGAPSASAADGPCPTDQGVTVVTDFSAFGGGTRQVCVPSGGGMTAAAITEAAGFPLTGVNNEQKFVCRVSGRPSQEDGENCVDTPSDKAFWGLFWSKGADEWSFSTYGAYALKVPDGGSVGWRFQDGGKLDEPSARPHRKAPKPTQSPKPTAGPRPSRTPKPSTAPQPSSPTTAAAPAAGAPATSAAPAKPKVPRKHRAGRTAAPSASASPSATYSAMDEPTEAQSADAADGSFATVTDDTPSGGDGNGLAAVAGLGGLSLLAGSAAVVAWRRRT